MRIPEVRVELRQLAVVLGCPRLDQLADELKRRRREPIKRPRARRVTAEIREKVKAYAKAHPTKLHREIGEKFGIDGGRVSEILHGKRR